MQTLYNHIFIHRFRKLNWLNNNLTKDNHWLFESVEKYKPLDPITKENILDYCIIEEDKNEQLRLLAQDSWAAHNHVWLTKMIEVDNPIRELVALFWHHHIPSSIGKNFEHGSLLLEIFRKYGLGNARELFVKVAANPAMIYYLDGHHSHKNNPNENFPRELLELFLLGEGNYTLQDVKEAARAFTGRRFNHKDYPYELYIDESAYDKKEKEFLGEKGFFNGEDIIDICLKQKQCARHLTMSIIEFFIAENPPKELVEDCAEFYYHNNYKTDALLKYIFQHSMVNTNTKWIKPKVKTPVELLVCFCRQTGYELKGIKTTRNLLRDMGQTLFTPPNVGGWPRGESWFTSNHVFYRIFGLTALIHISNRQHPKDSLVYKVKSRIDRPNLRSFRWNHDGHWNQNKYQRVLSDRNIKVPRWILGESNSMTLKECLESENYQYH